MRLLLAEDERALSKVLVVLLEKNGYAVEAVYDGRSALKHLESEIYDGAILDVMMPEMDGITVLRTLRENGNGIPVMILTAKSDVEDKVAGFDSGANDYLPKPFDTRELLARIRVMMRMQSLQADPVSDMENIKLNHTTLEISSGNGSFRLSRKEYQMMKLFMDNPYIPISAEYFYEKIWGACNGEENQTVWAYVSFLRKKLKVLHAEVRIREIDEKSYQLEKLETVEERNI